MKSGKWTKYSVGFGLVVSSLIAQPADVLILIVAYSINEISMFLVFLLFLANILLDIAEGYAARKYGRASEFGAAFDQEIDAFFVLVAGMYFYQLVGLEYWVLIPGLLRYGYRLVAWSLKGEQLEKRRRPLLAVMAGVNFCLITVVVMLPASPQFDILVISTAVVSASFSISLWEVFGYPDDRPYPR